MPVPTHEEARQVITPERERRLVVAFEAAWEDWSDGADRTRYGRWARTRANMVFERVAHHLQRVFADDPGVRPVFRDETIKLVFDDVLVVRFKKANPLGVGSNIATQAITRFVEPQLELDGLAGLKKVEVVYELNALQTAIARVVAQARDGDMRLWAWTLGEGAAGAEIVPFPLPLPPTAGPPHPSIASDAADEVVQPKQPSRPDEATERD